MHMRRIGFGLGLLTVTFATMAASAGCQGPANESTPSAGDEALSALTSNEILGSIAYGQTIGPVAYTSKPHYRAWSFTAHAGDVVSAWVRSSTGGYPRAWLLSSTFATIETGKYPTDTTATRVTHSLPVDGTYYVAFRDVNLAPGTFTVELDGPGGTDAGTTSYFDDSLLSGTPITQAQAVALFQPGQTTTPLGLFGVQQRIRSCNQTTGCGPWQSPATVTFAYMTYELWEPRSRLVRPAVLRGNSRRRSMAA